MHGTQPGQSVHSNSGGKVCDVFDLPADAITMPSASVTRV